MTNTSVCEDFAEDYSAWLDGELDAARAAQVRAHVEGCARCAEQIEALRSVDALLRAAPAPAVPADLPARLRARIAADERRAGESARPAPGRAASELPARARARRAGMAAPRRSRVRIAAAALGAAAAVAAALVLFAVGTGPRDLGVGQPQIVAVAPPSEEPALDLLDVEKSSDREVVEIAVVLELETLEDLDVIANLELLERLIALEEGTG